MVHQKNELSHIILQSHEHVQLYPKQSYGRMKICLPAEHNKNQLNDYQ